MIRKGVVTLFIIVTLCVLSFSENVSLELTVGAGVFIYILCQADIWLDKFMDKWVKGE